MILPHGETKFKYFTDTPVVNICVPVTKLFQKYNARGNGQCSVKQIQQHKLSFHDHTNESSANQSEEQTHIGKCSDIKIIHNTDLNAF